MQRPVHAFEQTSEQSSEQTLEQAGVRTLAAELPARAGEDVRLAGWIHRRRRLASVTFVVLRDRSGLAQVVVRDPATVERIEEYAEETVVEVTGKAVANPQAPGGVEVGEPAFTPLTDPAPTPPIELWRPAVNAGLPTLLDHAPVTLRHPLLRAPFELAAAAVAGFRETLTGLAFTEIQTPKIVASATESGANVFKLDYFGRPAYLAQSPQFYKQTMVGVFERVFEVGPVFRAEPHDTVRHLAEYVSLDAEFGFVRDHRDVMEVVSSVVGGMLAAVGERAPAALDRLGVELPKLPPRIPELHFADALALVGADPDEPDLAPAHERAIGEWALREHGSDFVFVVGYPMRKRPFYTHPQPDDPRWSNSFDLLFRGVELVTGGQRLHRYADYLAALEAAGQPAEPYATYLETFRYGMPPHGGFAFGLERFVARLVGAENIRQVTLFPRDLHRLAP
ncbi:nondiscriminating aspartyl-tRNA synthetase [Actinopolymorpha cephalotaxi]|uniref:Aspartate--tRNA(Asp/Asn) ligase n=1 Tax=Actinopolymorpha cephalotaxi TaxID=504797 RepID=A0A1I2Z4B6_9ACTN|nr:aspartate--tRNA(Asn) ligase [Actinopolymorpha cephalotaxi]NYH81852.1 nondiscriminating aspartyl-tRNA synthetase [Actinopolymorpha cephalotaxi]SFH32644.1 nondiscriminating aspartyl-tRNA synthetase [Actinopolymorpha cephalotaxi]